MNAYHRKISANRLFRREQIESELSVIPPIAPATQKLLSKEGFIDYYLEMQSLYDSQCEAYERLEEYYTAVTGQRRYSEYDSFRNVLKRWLAAQNKH